MSKKFKLNLGDEVEDIFTGFSGLVMCRTEWIHNCNTYGVQPKELKDGIPQERQFFDEPQLKLIREEVVEPDNDTGGPCQKIKSTAR